MESHPIGEHPGRESGSGTSWHRLLRAGLALLLIASVLYGSFLPFRVNRERLTTSHFRSTFLVAEDLNPEDVVVNIAVYAILAFGLLSLVTRRNFFAIVSVFWIGCVVSLAAEAGQTVIPQRVSSRADLGLNALGMLIGLLLHRPIWATMRRGMGLIALRLHRHPWSVSATLISTGLLVYGLLPFDFVTTSDDLHACFRRLQGPQWSGGLAWFANELGGAAWFAALGWLIARDVRSRGDVESVAVLAGLTHGLVLACLIETLQLFTLSHVPEVGAAIVRTLACLAGGWVGAYFPEARPVATRGMSRDIPLAFLFAGAAVLSGLPLLDSINSGSPGAGGGTFVASLPFHSLWQQPTTRAGAHAISILVSATLLTLIMLAILRRIGLARWRPLAGVFVVGLYLLAAWIAFRLKGSSFDATDALFALISGSIALAADRRLQSSMMRSPRPSFSTIRFRDY